MRVRAPWRFTYHNGPAAEVFLPFSVARTRCRYTRDTPGCARLAPKVATWTPCPPMSSLRRRAATSGPRPPARRPRGRRRQPLRVADDLPSLGRARVDACVDRPRRRRARRHHHRRRGQDEAPRPHEPGRAAPLRRPWRRAGRRSHAPRHRPDRARAGGDRGGEAGHRPEVPARPSRQPGHGQSPRAWSRESRERASASSWGDAVDVANPRQIFLEGRRSPVRCCP